MHVKISAHLVAWIEKEVRAWIASRAERSRSDTSMPGTQTAQATRLKEG